MNNSVDVLENLLESFIDEERSFYFKTKIKMEDGLLYKIPKLVISGRVHHFKPLNIIKPFFPLFYTNKTQFYQAQYKKRKIQTSLRGNLSGIPIFMDDKVEFSIYQNNKIIFSICDHVYSLMNEHYLESYSGHDLVFSIKLIKDGLSRIELEKQLESSSYIQNVLQQSVNYFKSSRFVMAKNKDKTNKIWLKEKLGIEDFDIQNLTISHLFQISKDVMILEKIISSFKSGVLSTEETMQMKKDKKTMKEQFVKLSNEQIYVFEETIVTLNCKIIK